MGIEKMVKRAHLEQGPEPFTKSYCKVEGGKEGISQTLLALEPSPPAHMREAGQFFPSKNEERRGRTFHLQRGCSKMRRGNDK
jgi:hypothetical protein